MVRSVNYGWVKMEYSKGICLSWWLRVKFRKYSVENVNWVEREICEI